MIHIAVDILVERDGQKTIVIGKKGAMLKAIGTEARTEIEEMLDRKVFLELFVKVREDWRQSPRWLKELEYLE
ncbi:MAG: KH domain-containing protein [Fimbriimonadaceae bacterium]